MNTVTFCPSEGRSSLQKKNFELRAFLFILHDNNSYRIFLLTGRIECFSWKQDILSVAIQTHKTLQPVHTIETTATVHPQPTPKVTNVYSQNSQVIVEEHNPPRIDSPVTGQ